MTFDVSVDQGAQDDNKNNKGELQFRVVELKLLNVSAELLVNP